MLNHIAMPTTVSVAFTVQVTVVSETKPEPEPITKETSEQVWFVDKDGKKILVLLNTINF